MNNGSSIPPWQSNNTKTESSTSPPWAKQVDNNTYQAPANPWSVPPPPGKNYYFIKFIISYRK